VTEEAGLRRVAVRSSADRRAARRLPLVGLYHLARAAPTPRARWRPRDDGDDSDGGATGGDDERAGGDGRNDGASTAAARRAGKVRHARAALRFVFLRAERRPFALVVRFLVP